MKLGGQTRIAALGLYQRFLDKRGFQLVRGHVKNTPQCVREMSTQGLLEELRMPSSGLDPCVVLCNSNCQVTWAFGCAKGLAPAEVINLSVGRTLQSIVEGHITKCSSQKNIPLHKTLPHWRAGSFLPDKLVSYLKGCVFCILKNSVVQSTICAQKHCSPVTGFPSQRELECKAYS